MTNTRSKPKKFFAITYVLEPKTNEKVLIFLSLTLAVICYDQKQIKTALPRILAEDLDDEAFIREKIEHEVREIKLPKRDAKAPVAVIFEGVMAKVFTHLFVSLSEKRSQPTFTLSPPPKKSGGDKPN